MLRTRSPRKEKISNCYLHSNSLSNKMDNSLLAVRDINHKYIVVEKEKHEIERVKEVFAEHLRQSPDFELLWSDKVGYVWLTIGVNPVYVDTGIRIESAADLCGRCLDDVAMDVLYMTGNDHALEAADPLELAEIKRRWEPYINQLPDYAYLCKDLLNGKM